MKEHFTREAAEALEEVNMVKGHLDRWECFIYTPIKTQNYEMAEVLMQ